MMKQEEVPGQSNKEVPCVEHPMAPHGFDRNGSHNEGHYVCECQGWFNEMLDDIIADEEYLLERQDIIGTPEKNALVIRVKNK